jgi:cysteine-rich repeat protein
VLGAVRGAWATTADDLCPPGTDPCVVAQGTTIAVSDGSVIDLEGRALVLAPGSGTRLDAGAGSMSILARSVTLNPGSALLARAGLITIMTSGDVAVLRAGSSRARIDVGDFTSPGAITIDAGGDIEVQGTVTAQGAGAEGGNGTITLTAGGDLVVSGEVNAAGGGNAIGGDASMRTLVGDVLLSGVIDVTAGSNGGTIGVSAGGSVSTLALNNARLDARADGAEGDGGSVDVDARSGDIVLNIPVTVQGAAGVDFAGSGGDVGIDALHGSVFLNAPIDLSGGAPDGDGGDLDASAGVDLVQTGTVTSTGRDQSGVGGLVDLFAERALTVGTVDVAGSCRNCSAGDVSAVAWCRVEIPSGVAVLANADGGSVHVRSGGDLVVHGRVAADWVINIFHRSATDLLDLSGAVFSPNPNVQLMPTLIPCGGAAAGNCGNGVTEAGETCDDHNTVSCDGCSSTCQIERCGDGRVGCDAQGRHEACDDGNTVGCDGCAADCTRRDRICGDGITECGEQCDTGAAIDCDPGACSAWCQIEGCGNGRVECAEQCDDGGASATCSATCLLLTPPMCGDGHQDPGEGCDDGNTADCDGCSRLCQPEGCGNGVVECEEECDDFNTTPCDGCSGSCHLETCGNGVVDCGEECDLGDDNGKPGTNCLACSFAPICSADVSGACIPCNDVLDCDPLGRCAGTDCLDGVCTPDPVDCTSDDPCEIGSCDPLDGCTLTPVLGFDSVRCRLGDLADVLGGDGMSEKARTKLGKLLDKASGKVDTAESALDQMRTKRVGKSLKKARSSMVRFGKKIVKLQPKQITDPNVGAALSEGSGDALGRIDALRSGLGF